MLLAAAPALAQGGKKKSKGDDTEQKDQQGDEDEEQAAEDEEAFVEPDAWEQPPPDEEKPPPDKPKPVVEEKVGDGLPWSAGLLLGWGFKTDRRSGGLRADPYGFGFGARGGYTLDFAMYVGLYFIYYLGSTQEGPSTSGGVAGNFETSANYMHFGAEVGYDVWTGPVILRPSLQIGSALGILSQNGESDSVGDIAFNPGMIVMHPIDEFFLGGDLRAHIVTGDGVSAIALFATGGIRFE